MSKGDLQAVAWQGDYCELWAQRRTANELASSGGPKGWSGEHTKRSAVRSHGTPRKRSAERCEDAERPCRTEPANKKSRGNEVKIGERRGEREEKKGYSKQTAAKASIKKSGSSTAS